MPNLITYIVAAIIIKLGKRISFKKGSKYLIGQKYEKQSRYSLYFRKVEIKSQEPILFLSSLCSRLAGI